MTRPSVTNDLAFSSWVVGKTRVRDVDGFCGTLKYIGPVASAKNELEIYAGIEWDDPSRGKHDGSVICRRTKQLVRHFSCHGNGGTFLRLSKVDIGVPLDLRAIQSKYVEPEAPLVAPKNILAHVARTSSGRDKPIEFHGELKLRAHQQVEILSRIAFRNMGISSIDDSLTGFENVIEVDLGGNLFCDWNFMPKLLHAFPALTALSLASNKIGDLEEPLVVKNIHMRILNLHSCGIKSFSSIQKLENVFPKLEQLCVAYNNLSDLILIPTISGFDALSRLDVSSCNLSHWDDHIQKFSNLPEIETMLLCDNALTSFPDPMPNDSFLKLKKLDLTGTLVQDWTDIQGLAALKKLCSLTLRSTPLTASMGASEARYLIIARFPTLETVNLSHITSKERLEAERRYVTNVTQEILSARGKGEDENDFLSKRHPLFGHLAAKYLTEMQQQVKGIDNRAISSYAVNVTISSMAPNSCQIQPIQKRLPSSLTVGRVKALCARIFGLDVDLQMLHYRSEGDAFPVELQDSENTLGFYGVSDGGEILMNELNLDAIERDEENEREDHHQRMQEQEKKLANMQNLQKDRRTKGLM